MRLISTTMTLILALGSACCGKKPSSGSGGDRKASSKNPYGITTKKQTLDLKLAKVTIEAPRGWPTSKCEDGTCITFQAPEPEDEEGLTQQASLGITVVRCTGTCRDQMAYAREIVALARKGRSVWGKGAEILKPPTAVGQGGALYVVRSPSEKRTDVMSSFSVQRLGVKIICGWSLPHKWAASWKTAVRISSGLAVKK